MHKDILENQEEHQDSVPRLELGAAQLLAVTQDMIVRESKTKFDNIYMFTDSSTVLNWINDPDKKFKTYESFRVKKSDC